MNTQQFQSLSDSELEQAAGGGDGLFENVLGKAGHLLDGSLEAVAKIPGTVIDGVGNTFGFLGAGIKGFGDFLKGINTLPKLG
jgi:hypothetical protein